ncbi:unnamed protein product [Amoebophrya sp. A120]|nr:unnamed protein product [Amoebophrya sp. A120]|eukprot:GSA120T00014167001.1
MSQYGAATASGNNPATGAPGNAANWDWEDFYKNYEFYLQYANTSGGQHDGAQQNAANKPSTPANHQPLVKDHIPLQFKPFEADLKKFPNFYDKANWWNKNGGSNNAAQKGGKNNNSDWDLNRYDTPGAMTKGNKNTGDKNNYNDHYNSNHNNTSSYGNSAYNYGSSNSNSSSDPYQHKGVNNSAFGGQGYGKGSSSNGGSSGKDWASGMDHYKSSTNSYHKGGGGGPYDKGYYDKNNYTGTTYGGNAPAGYNSSKGNVDYGKGDYGKGDYYAKGSKAGLGGGGTAGAASVDQQYSSHQPGASAATSTVQQQQQNHYASGFEAGLAAAKELLEKQKHLEESVLALKATLGQQQQQQNGATTTAVGAANTAGTAANVLASAVSASSSATSSASSSPFIAAQSVARPAELAPPSAVNAIAANGQANKMNKTPENYNSGRPAVGDHAIKGGYMNNDGNLEKELQQKLNTPSHIPATLLQFCQPVDSTSSGQNANNGEEDQVTASSSNKTAANNTKASTSGDLLFNLSNLVQQPKKKQWPESTRTKEHENYRGFNAFEERIKHQVDQRIHAWNRTMIEKTGQGVPTEITNEVAKQIVWKQQQAVAAAQQVWQEKNNGTAMNHHGTTTTSNNPVANTFNTSFNFFGNKNTDNRYVPGQLVTMKSGVAGGQHHLPGTAKTDTEPKKDSTLPIVKDPSTLTRDSESNTSKDGMMNNVKSAASSSSGKLSVSGKNAAVPTVAPPPPPPPPSAPLQLSSPQTQQAARRLAEQAQKSTQSQAIAVQQAAAQRELMKAMVAKDTTEEVPPPPPPLSSDAFNKIYDNHQRFQQAAAGVDAAKQYVGEQVGGASTTNHVSLMQQQKDQNAAQKQFAAAYGALASYYRGNTYVEPGLYKQFLQNKMLLEKRLKEEMLLQGHGAAAEGGVAGNGTTSSCCAKSSCCAPSTSTAPTIPPPVLPGSCTTSTSATATTSATSSAATVSDMWEQRSSAASLWENQNNAQQKSNGEPSTVKNPFAGYWDQRAVSPVRAPAAAASTGTAAASPPTVPPPSMKVPENNSNNNTKSNNFFSAFSSVTNSPSSQQLTLSPSQSQLLNLPKSINGEEQIVLKGFLKPVLLEEMRHVIRIVEQTVMNFCNVQFCPEKRLPPGFEPTTSEDDGNNSASSKLSSKKPSGVASSGDNSSKSNARNKPIYNAFNPVVVSDADFGKDLEEQLTQKLQSSTSDETVAVSTSSATKNNNDEEQGNSNTGSKKHACAVSETGNIEQPVVEEEIEPQTDRAEPIPSVIAKTTPGKLKWTVEAEFDSEAKTVSWKDLHLVDHTSNSSIATTKHVYVSSIKFDFNPQFTCGISVPQPPNSGNNSPSNLPGNNKSPTSSTNGNTSNLLADCIRNRLRSNRQIVVNITEILLKQDRTGVDWDSKQMGWMNYSKMDAKDQLHYYLKSNFFTKRNMKDNSVFLKLRNNESAVLHVFQMLESTLFESNSSNSTGVGQNSANASSASSNSGDVNVAPVAPATSALTAAANTASTAYFDPNTGFVPRIEPVASANTPRSGRDNGQQQQSSTLDDYESVMAAFLSTAGADGSGIVPRVAATGAVAAAPTIAESRHSGDHPADMTNLNPRELLVSALSNYQTQLSIRNDFLGEFYEDLWERKDISRKRNQAVSISFEQTGVVKSLHYHTRSFQVVGSP